MKAAPRLASLLPALVTGLAGAATVEQPRAFGHVLGDVLTQRVLLQHEGRGVAATAPPPAGARGPVARAPRGAQRRPMPRAARWLAIDYQVVNAPRSLSMVTLPALSIAVDAGAPLSLPAWPVERRSADAARSVRAGRFAGDAARSPGGSALHRADRAPAAGVRSPRSRSCCCHGSPGGARGSGAMHAGCPMRWPGVSCGGWTRESASVARDAPRHRRRRRPRGPERDVAAAPRRGAAAAAAAAQLEEFYRGSDQRFFADAHDDAAVSAARPARARCATPRSVTADGPCASTSLNR